MTDLRLGPPTLVVWCGALAQLQSVWWMIGGLIVWLATLIWTTPFTATIRVCSVALICVSVTGAMTTYSHHTDSLELDAQSGHYARVVMSVVSHPSRQGEHTRFLGRAQAVEYRGQGSTTHLLVDVTTQEPVTLGEHLIVRGKLSVSSRGDANVALRGTVEGRMPLNIFLSAAATMRNGLRNHLEYAQPDVAALLSGVVVGDDSQLDRGIKDHMRGLSLSHLTAVSGAHVSLVIGAIVSLIGVRNRWLTAFSTFGGVLALLLLVGPDSSVLRAFWMGLGVCVGFACRRPVTAFPLLCVTVIGVSMFDPELASSFGFVLSVLATAAIVTVGRHISMALSFFPHPLGEMIAIPMVAGLATAPVIALLQNEVSIWGTLANIVVAPVVAPLTIAGLAGAVLLSIPGLAWCGGLLVWGAQLCTRWILVVTEIFTDFPLSKVPIFVAMATHAGVLGILMAFSRHRQACQAHTEESTDDCERKSVIPSWNNGEHAVERDTTSAGHPDEIRRTGFC
ncbi:ComEC/Rec2 family competence protein [Arcanobacterium canis]